MAHIETTYCSCLRCRRHVHSISRGCQRDGLIKWLPFKHHSLNGTIYIHLCLDALGKPQSYLAIMFCSGDHTRILADSDTEGKTSCAVFALMMSISQPSIIPSEESLSRRKRSAGVVYCCRERQSVLRVHTPRLVDDTPAQ